MKSFYNNTFTLILLIHFVFINNFHAQDCQDQGLISILEGNNISTPVQNNGSIFSVDFASSSNYHFIEPSGIPEASVIHSHGMWIGGKNSSGDLKLSVARYSSSTNSRDYFPGPINNDNGELSFDCDNFNFLWEVLGNEIIQHKNDFLDNGIIDNPIPNIFAYPAHQNPHFEGIHGFVLPNTPQGLAPFFDQNNDGIYNPNDGDFPSPESLNSDITPSHLIWSVYNDGADIHSYSGGAKLNMEVQQTVWALTSTDLDILNNTIFTSHKLINRGSESLDSLFVSNWIDWSLGCPWDDYMGSIPDLNTFYGYNADAIDGLTGCECVGFPTYCDQSPVHSITFLNKQMSSFGINLIDTIPNDLLTPNEYYNMMKGK